MSSCLVSRLLECHESNLPTGDRVPTELFLESTSGIGLIESWESKYGFTASGSIWNPGLFVFTTKLLFLNATRSLMCLCSNTIKDVEE